MVEVSLEFRVIPDYGFGSIVRVYDRGRCVGVFDTMADAVVGMADYDGTTKG